MKNRQNKPRILADWERKLIHDTSHPCRLAAMIMLHEGLRRKEVLALRADHILLDDGAIYVERYVQLWESEGGYNRSTNMRRVPIMDPVKTDLEAFVACSDDDQLVFPAPADFTSAWKNYMSVLSEKHGDKVDISCQDLRNAFIHDAIDAGVNPKDLRRWCGLSSARTITEMYNHAKEE